MFIESDNKWRTTPKGSNVNLNSLFKTFEFYGFISITYAQQKTSHAGRLIKYFNMLSSISI